MHRLIAATVLTLSVILVIFFGTRIIKENCTAIKKQVNVFLEDINDNNWDKAKKETNKSAEFWNDKENIMAVFIKGDVLDDISICYYELKTAVLIEDKNDALIKCSKLKGLINEITEKEKFSVMSFF